MGKKLKYIFIVTHALLQLLSCKESPEASGEKEANIKTQKDTAIPTQSVSKKINAPLPKEKNAHHSKPKVSLPKKEFQDMLLVNGGTFTMGLNHPRAIPDEKTEHTVSLKSFYLDKTEVTNAEYQKCVSAKVCRRPRDIDTRRSGFAPLSVFRRVNHPVSGVSRRDALAFCKWKNKRLPTEAEFERAARGDDNRIYTWGDDSPTSEHAVYASKATAPVASKVKGIGPYGHFDLAGNVWEWTADLYDPFAYMRDTANIGVPADCDTIKQTQNQLRKEGKQGFTGTNPIPVECDHVLRGGAFNYFSWGLRASNRVHHPESWRIIMAGFRCAKDVNQ